MRLRPRRTNTGRPSKLRSQAGGAGTTFPCWCWFWCWCCCCCCCCCCFCCCCCCCFCWFVSVLVMTVGTDCRAPAASGWGWRSWWASRCRSRRPCRRRTRRCAARGTERHPLRRAERRRRCSEQRRPARRPGRRRPQGRRASRRQRRVQCPAWAPAPGLRPALVPAPPPAHQPAPQPALRLGQRPAPGRHSAWCSTWHSARWDLHGRDAPHGDLLLGDPDVVEHRRDVAGEAEQRAALTGAQRIVVEVRADHRPQDASGGNLTILVPVPIAKTIDAVIVEEPEIQRGDLGPLDAGVLRPVPRPPPA